LFKLSTRYEDRAFHLKEQWRHALFVPEAERCRLLATYPQNLGPFSSLQASGAICFALVQDLGIALLILISFKNLFSLIRQRILLWLRVGPQINESNNLQSAKQLLETME
jgi:hypothetical protein